jgi:hypothetical protein
MKRCNLCGELVSKLFTKADGTNPSVVCAPCVEELQTIDETSPSGALRAKMKEVSLDSVCPDCDRQMMYIFDQELDEENPYALYQCQPCEYRFHFGGLE